MVVAKPNPASLLPTPAKPAAEINPDLLTATKIEKFDKTAKKLGYTKVTVPLTDAQKIIRTSLLSFAIMALLLWADWFVSSVDGNVWTGTWAGFVQNCKLTAIMFTQICLAKVKQYYDQSKTVTA